MIPKLHGRAISSAHGLAESLGRPVSNQEGLTTEGTVIAYWSLLDYYTDLSRIWTSVEWAQHLDDPNWQHPFAASPQGDRRTILHLSVRLHPDDRELTPAEWAEVGHRLARVTGISPPGDEQACRWIAIRDQSHRLDLLANLIREDGNWAAMPAQVLHVLAAECRRIEADLGLLSPRDHHAVGPFQQHTPAVAQTTGDMLDSGRVAHMSDEANRHLAAARRLVEKAAQQLGTRPSNAPGLAHQLEWIARRAHALESDLAEITPRRPHTAAGGPAARLPVSLPSARASRTR
ncbi:relaxase/mobilization nuclease [Streptomyces yangpuensis]|uniref:relaxase/mobilization nuclease n=1 Tax=Streptomyces yangpuensis TaxID=1648182 RepID=UPI0034447881